MVAQIPDDRTLLNAALDWKLGRVTQLTLLATYNKGKSLYDYGKPFDGTLLPNPNGRLSRTLFVGEPCFDKFNTEGTTLGYLFEHRLSENWRFRQNLLAFDYEADNAYAAIQSRANAATGLRTVNRSATSRFDTDKGWALDNQLIGNFATGSVRHTLPAPNNSYQSAKQLGLYVQNQLKLGENWIAMLGARYDDAENGSRSVTAAGAASASTQKSHAFTPRAGLMYLFANGVAPYYSYTRSFQPTSGVDFFLRPFEPTEGKQHEIGVKYEPQGTNASVTFAAYQLTQRNVLTSDPDHPGSSIQTGEIQSKGFELEGKAAGLRANVQNADTDDAFIELEHKLANGGLIKAAVRDVRRDNLYRSGRANGAAAANGDFRFEFVDLAGYLKDRSYDLYLATPFTLLGRDHRLLLGASRNDRDTGDGNYVYGPPGTFNIFKPNYDLAYPSLTLPGYTGVTTREENALYTQGQFSITDRLKIMAGGRLSWAEVRSRRTSDGVVTASTKPGRQFTPSVSALYDLTPHVTAYASYVETFVVQGQLDAAKNLLPPRTGKQIEFGVKGEFFNKRLQTQAAVFRILDTNRAITDPVVITASIAGGDVCSQGLELDRQPVGQEVLREGFWRCAAELLR